MGEYQVSFKLNMTDEVETAVDFEFPPTGNYLCRISDIVLETVSKPGDNFGKPYWKLTLTVDEGQYAGKTIPTQITLYEANTWSLLNLKQLCEAIHPEYISGKEINLPTVENGMPDPGPWLGQLVQVRGTKFPAGTVVANGSRKGEIREYDEFKMKFRKATKTDNRSSSTGLPLPS